MQPIETLYGGYRFRSRLEARWAVFFDALKIEYRYEPEGYNLEGIWYLPDFWLPQQNCWIEIKPEAMLVNRSGNAYVVRDTREEDEKAQLLAWYTEKDVYILGGDVWKVENPFLGQRRRFHKIDVLVKNRFSSYLRLSLLPEIAILLFKIQELGIKLSIRVVNGRARTAFEHSRILTSFSIEEMLKFIERQRSELPSLFEQVQQQIPKILAALALLPDLEEVSWLEVRGGYIKGRYEWVVCEQCKKAHLHYYAEDDCPHCSCFGRECRGDEQLLLTAYAWARQARFDGRDHFPWQYDKQNEQS